jgi:hypothetical protein
MNGPTLTGTVTATGATITGGILGSATITNSTLYTLKMTAGPSGTEDGLAWTTAPPAFTTGQKFITLTAGSTTYRVPVFLNA